MSNLLAIEASTDMCSVALLRDGEVIERNELAPRQHNQRLLGLIEALVSPVELQRQRIDAVAFGSGPGSFTGLRIAASLAQGLCYAATLPAIGVSTLAALAQRALREQRVGEKEKVLVMLDARIDEVYVALYEFRGGIPSLVEGPIGCAPESVPLMTSEPVHLVGEVGPFLERLSSAVADTIASMHDGLLPLARDLLPLAAVELEAGRVVAAAGIQPLYVREEIAWKKLSEQGKSA